MKVDKLERLFQALDNSAEQAKNAKIAEFPKQLASASDEAVRVAENFGGPQTDESSSGKDIGALREKYLREGYSPNRGDVVRALARDLF
jgi:hypothetical protein